MKNKDLGLLLIRLAVGILLLMHGINKIFHGIEGVKNTIGDTGIPELFAYGVYIGEVIAPLMLALGFRTRIASLLVFANMLVIIFIAHPGDIFSLSGSGAWELELQGLYLLGSLALFFTGGGKYALSSGNRWD
ncbi:MAG: DoxX family protein [Bacteroidales bacterium]